AARGADEDHELAVPDMQVDALKNRHIAESLGHALKLNICHAAVSSHCSLWLEYNGCFVVEQQQLPGRFELCINKIKGLLLGFVVLHVVKLHKSSAVSDTGYKASSRRL
ncbi:MAG: hypothetical protein K2W93_06045, partial [Burkholderiaceae bacterium]|nr:hypothetical protein [Burkholderiaceae bacterium]